MKPKALQLSQSAIFKPCYGRYFKWLPASDCQIALAAPGQDNPTKRSAGMHVENWKFYSSVA